MDRYKFSPKLIIGVLLAAFFSVSLIYRIGLPFDQVFSSVGIKFTSIDAYYYMRLVDNLAHNFPHITSFDPFFIFPGGQGIADVNIFHWLQTCVAWIIGLGSPSQHTVDVVCVCFPAVLAALTIIPVYFIGKALFNRWAGLIAAALVAILPGEFMGRSILGANDTPIAEIFFTATVMAFFILAIKTAVQRQLTFSNLIQRDWKVIVRPLVYSLLAGFFLGIYLITWQGALLFIFIISLYLIIQFIVNHLQRKSSEYLGIIGVILFLVALIIFLPRIPARDLAVAMVVALLIPIVLAAISLLISRKGLRPVYYPASLIGIGIVFIAIFYAIAPDTLGVMWNKFSFVFFPGGATAATTLEMQPFLSPQGNFSTAVAWGNFTTSFFLTPDWPIPGFAFIAFVVLIWLYIKRRNDEQHWLLFLIWSLVILVATLAQRRFAYYFVINIALLSAYLSWQPIWYAGLRKLVITPDRIGEGVQKETTKGDVKKKGKESRGIPIYYVNTVLVIIVVFFFVLFPNIVKAKEVASQAHFAPSDAWQASLSWMKDNTPEPFDDPDAYYRLYEPVSRPWRDWPRYGVGTDELLEWMNLLEKSFDYPESTYTVLSWWDYGYWITRIAHRLPNANPSQDPAALTLTARFLLSQEEDSTREIVETLRTSYIVADYSMATSKFWAITNWAGQEQDEFIGIFHMPYEGQLIPVQLFLPEYYRSMCIRLYNFDGEAVTEVSPVVISYDEKVDREGNHYKQINNIEEFSSYQEALDFIESEGSSKHIIVGINPFVSPVRLEALQNYRLVYASESGVENQDAGMIPEVKIFEYLGD